MSAGRICTRVVATVTPSESVGTAARRMTEFDVGTVVVVDPSGNGRAVGIVTDRDIVVRCVAGWLDPDQTSVARIMTSPVHTISEQTPVEDTVAQMARVGTRRLVVTDEAGHMTGIISLDDVMDLLQEETRAVGRLMERQRAPMHA